MMKKILSGVALLFAVTFLFPSNNAYAGQCIIGENGIDPAVVAAGVNCITQPSTYQITVYEIGLCTEPPLKPADGESFDLTSHCSVAFTSGNPAGSTTIVSDKTGTPLQGTIYTLPNITYQYAYVKIAAEGSVSSILHFSGLMRPLTDLTHIGNYCWTVGSTATATQLKDYSHTQNGRLSESGAPILTSPIVDCGDPVAGTTPDTFGATSVAFDAIYQSGGTPSNFDTNGQGFYGYLLDSNFNLLPYDKLGSPAEGHRILVVTSIPPVTITPGAKLQLELNNSNGAITTVNAYSFAAGDGTDANPPVYTIDSITLTGFLLKVSTY